MIFPNPTSNDLNISLETEIPGKKIIRLFNGLGQAVYQERLTDFNTTINVNALSSGVYLLNISVENGKNYFYTRRGQLNLSCHQCHDQNWGRKMRGDTVSQGHINGFPTYRNDWQTLGSSHRRFEACDIGVRAEPLPLGSQTYIDLEVYLKARGNGLSVETPSIRR